MIRASGVIGLLVGCGGTVSGPVDFCAALEDEASEACVQGSNGLCFDVVCDDESTVHGVEGRECGMLNAPRATVDQITLDRVDEICEYVVHSEECVDEETSGIRFYLLCP